jgi:tetratricopeptide (TPR) repeat protein
MLLTKNIYFPMCRIRQAMDASDYDEALFLIKKLEEQYGQDLGAYIVWVKGVALDYSKDPFEALKCFDKAITLDRTCYFFYESLRTCLNGLRGFLNVAVNDENITALEIKNMEVEMKDLGYLSFDLGIEFLKNYLSRSDLNNFDRLFADLYRLNPKDSQLCELAELRITESKRYLIS